MTNQTLTNATTKPEYGGKINNLIKLKALNLSVPNGLIITDTTDATALKIQLSQFMQEGTTYIVRSSGQHEDGVKASYAGQYTSVRDCRSLEEVWQGINECLTSQNTAEAESYTQKIGLAQDNLPLAVLVQEQMEADISGIAFSINPLTNHDQEILIETTEGAGDVLADGLVEPLRQSLAWHSPQTDTKLETLRQSILEAANYFGYPLDIEFCFSKGQLFIVQARPITRLTAKVSMGSWTTANFRDGGVSAQACPGLMWSLYREAWQVALETFMLDNKLLDNHEVYRLALIKYARPYWNVGLVKVAMARVPGYTEREFDDELGIHKAYSGDGTKSQLTPKSLWQLVKLARRLSSTTRHHQAQADNLKADLLRQYESYQNKLTELASKSHSTAEVESLWLDITCEGQLASETVYFKQVYINTVQLSMKKTAVLKHISVEAFFQLISKLGKVSHLRPVADLLLIRDLINQETSLKTYWEETSTQQLTLELKQALSDSTNQRGDLKQLVEWLHTYGYHSERELNLLWPSFSEAPGPVIDKVKELLKNHRPELAMTQSLSAKEMDTILQAEAINKRRARKIKTSILSLRNLLWWREEFKDLSTRYYHLVRQISLLLGKHYSEKGILEHADDIFYLEKECVLQWINRALTKSQLQESARHNRLYCQAYRNYAPSGDLQVGSSQTSQFEAAIGHLQGIGANDGVVRGRVRVLTDVSQINHLEREEILVTPFTDTGWSHRFGSMQGLITETGGVLSHATIVAREFGLPAIIGAKQATKRLRTGMLIEMNGATGTIYIIDSLKDESR